MKGSWGDEAGFIAALDAGETQDGIRDDQRTLEASAEKERVRGRLFFLSSQSKRIETVQITRCALK